MKRPDPGRDYVEHFRARVLQDALAEATAAYWRRRAEAFAAVGTPTCDEIAQACRAKAALSLGATDSDRLAAMDATERRVLSEVRQMILDANPHNLEHDSGECELCDYAGILEAVIDDRLTPVEDLDEPDR